MKEQVASYFSGLLFAVGLGVSGMTRADKVIGFLNLPGGWDPSLAFVMMGAIAVHLVLFRLILRRGRPLFGRSFGIPTRSDLDRRLLGGAALFGVGWALGGYCPGPGLVSIAGGSSHALTFVATMIVGMLAFHAVEAGLEGRRQQAAPGGKP